MSKHSHVVLKTCPEDARAWSAREVALRWLCVFPKRRKKNRKAGDDLEAVVDLMVRDHRLIEKLRKRLSSIAWFMMWLNEFIGKKANA